MRSDGPPHGPRSETMETLHEEITPSTSFSCFKNLYYARTTTTCTFLIFLIVRLKIVSSRYSLKIFFFGLRRPWYFCELSASCLTEF